MAGQLEGDLLVIAFGQRVLAGPCEDGLDEVLAATVRSTNGSQPPQNSESSAGTLPSRRNASKTSRSSPTA